tara:strand:- start:98291 stop:102307 length:4017 start_codon:yes stop_codon:yes gene_type:complete
MKFKYFFLVWITIFSSVIFSQNNEENYVIDFITTKQGLSHNYVSSTVSDDLNLKWIGTENGITKFNGFDFEYIKPNDKFNELLNENIETLFLDNNSNLWIGTKSGGLSYLDIKNNEIKNYNYLIDLAKEGDLRITAISQDVNGNIWVGTWRNGVFVIDVKEDKLIEHYNYYQQIQSIVKDYKNNMWFCSGNKLMFFDIKKQKITRYDFNFTVYDILSDKSRKKIWIASGGKNENLYSFNYESKKIDSIYTGVISSFSKKLSLDKYNRIWIGTWRNGLYRSNEELSTFSKIHLVSESSEKIRSNYNTILNIHHDINNITWLSTAGGGLIKIMEGNGFKNINRQLKNKELKDFFNCSAIFKTSNRIFIGTMKHGVYYGKDYQNLQQIKSLGNVKVNSFYKHENKLYIGTADGFAVFDLKQEKIIFSNLAIKKVTAFLISDAKLFLGTQQVGLAIVNLNEINNLDSYVFYSEKFNKNLKLESDRVTTIVKDKSQKIWVGTYNGIHLYDSKNQTFSHQSTLLEEKLPSVIINSIAVRDKNLWLATPNGLIKLRITKADKLKVEKILTKENNLNSDFICALTFDNESNIWFSTHTEIVKYDYIKNIITSYGDINGIKTTSFNNNSFFNYQKDAIFFGGMDNVTYFNPSNIKDYNNIPEIVFTKLRVNNQIIDYNKGNTILDKNFNYAEKINLSHKEDFFSTSFVVNDFLGNLNVKYQYKLEGDQKDWNDLQNRNEINFAGLSPGKYNIKVKASRDNQNWSSPKSLQISLMGSPWKSTLAILIYIVIISLIIFYLISSNNAKIRLENNLKIAKIDKEKENELTEAKLNFFTNISHEFRTPLTLIISPLKELLESNDLSSKVAKNLSYIERNTTRLLNLINQLLDFRKADHGLLKLDVSHGNFVRFSNEVYLYFKEAAKAKNIKYSFKAENDEINFPFDRNKMEIVLCNVLSNALKYTADGDKIKMTINTDKNFCTIIIKDSGIGMKSEDLDKIFDRFFQIKSANTASMIGSGIGLSFSKKIVQLHHGSISAKSKLNQGTEFIIKLAMDQKLYEGMIDENFIKSDDIKGYIKNRPSEELETLNLNSKKHTVLIIDDNPDILSYLSDILIDTYNVIKAENGDIGFNKASSEIPDLIISDLMMPGKDGITLCKELKSQITTSHIPIILLTARTSTVFEIEGLKTGANDYVTKPFDSLVIKARVESLLENRDKLRAHLLNKVRFEPTINDLNEDSDIENNFITKAIVLVENNLENNNFGIDTMVDELNMSRSSLFRKIKSLTGLSLSAFIRSIRLKKAANLILISELNLSQISYEVGFNDYKYFKTSFKKQFDCLPSKYKEKIIKSNS